MGLFDSVEKTYKPTSTGKQGSSSTRSIYNFVESGGYDEDLKRRNAFEEQRKKTDATLKKAIADSERQVAEARSKSLGSPADFLNQAFKDFARNLYESNPATQAVRANGGKETWKPTDPGAPTTDLGRAGEFAGQAAQTAGEIFLMAKGGKVGGTPASAAKLAETLKAGSRASRYAGELVEAAPRVIKETGIGMALDHAAGRDQDIAKNAGISIGAEVAAPVLGKLIGAASRGLSKSSKNLPIPNSPIVDTGPKLLTAGPVSSGGPNGFTLVDDAAIAQRQATEKAAESFNKQVAAIDRKIKAASTKPNPDAGQLRSLMRDRRDLVSGSAEPIKRLEPKAVAKTPYATTDDYLADLAQIKPHKSKPLEAARSLIDDVREKFADSNTPIEDALARARKSGADITPSNDLSYQIDKVLRSDQLSTMFIRDNGLEQIIKDVPDIKAFDQYLIARHSADLTKQGITTGRNAEADARLVADLTGEYEPYAQQISQYSHKLLDYAVDSGLINKRVATTLKKKYPNYVPMNRVMEELDNGLPIRGTGSGPASIGSQSVVQNIKGSERDVISPMESLLVKTGDAFEQGERNRAAKILASYESLPGNPFNLRELKASETKGTKSTISFLDNGKKRTFETTPEIERAAKNMNRQQIGLLGQLFAVPTRVLRLTATGANLPFTVSNLARDQVTLAIQTDKKLATSLLNPQNFLRALTNAAGNGAEYDNLMRAAAGGTSYDIGRNTAAQTVSKLRAGRNAKSNIAYHVTHPADFLRAVEDLVGKSENLTRIQAFTGTRDSLIKQGVPEAEAIERAARAARQDTTDFLRSGSWGRVANAAVPYFNAGIQGSRAYMRSMKRDPKGTIAGTVALAYLPVATVTAWNLADEKRRQAYMDIADYEKEGNLIIIPPNPTKNDKGEWNAIKIPIAQAVAPLTNSVRNGIETLTGVEGFDVGGLLANLIKTGTSLDVSSPRAVGNQITPQGLKPVVEGLTNQNLYTGNPIVPESKRYLPGQEQFGDYTSATAIELGNLTGLSPYHIENAVRTTTSGVGRQALNAIDSALAGVGRTSRDHVSGENPLQGIAGRFYGASGRAVDDRFWTLQKQVDAKKQQTSSRVNALIKEGKRNEAWRLVDEWNASLEGKFKDFQSQYGDGYGDRIEELRISDTSRAKKSRETRVKNGNN